MNDLVINRRKFLQGAAASLALATMGAGATASVTPEKKYRVGLIGTGWYGKSHLFRLIQVAPVEVIALCDVDKNMLAGATGIDLAVLVVAADDSVMPQTREHLEILRLAKRYRR